MPTFEMSRPVLEVVCRAVADRGEDYGWSVYRRGYEIPAGERERLIAFDENAADWLAAWDAVSAAYAQAEGEPWRY
jgi:hypothetical protein